MEGPLLYQESWPEIPAGPEVGNSCEVADNIRWGMSRPTGDSSTPAENEVFSSSELSTSIVAGRRFQRNKNNNIKSSIRRCSFVFG